MLGNLDERLAVALLALAEREHSKCVREHDVVETGKNLTRAVEMTPIGRGPVLSAARRQAVQEKENCERFELDYSSQITYVAPTGTGVSIIRVQGLKLNRDNSWKNEAPLDYWSFDYPPICSYTRQVVEPFEAMLSSPSDWYRGSSPPKISMRVFTGLAQETVTSCVGEPLNQTAYLHSGGISALHGGTAWTINDWKYVGGVTFAERTYTGATAIKNNVLSEKTTFKLRHTPK